MKLLHLLFLGTSIGVLSASLAGAFQFPYTHRQYQQQLKADFQQQGGMSRCQWLQTAGGAFAAAVFTAAAPMPAAAKEVDPAVKGTKQDPEFEACLSQCIYECTKPKGAEQRSRKECLPECKMTCAKTKAQLMTGSPIK